MLQFVVVFVRFGDKSWARLFKLRLSIFWLIGVPSFI